MSKPRSERGHLRVVRDGAAAPPLPGGDLEPVPPAEVEPVEADVVEGELVASGPAAPPVRPRTITVVGRLVPAQLQPSERMVRASRGAAEAVVTLGRGWASWAVRAWDAATLGVHRRQIRAAEAAGDREALAEWIERKDQAVDRRRARLLALPRLALGLAKVAAGVLGGLAVLLPVVAMLVWLVGAGDFLDVFRWAGAVLRWLFAAAGLAWKLLVAGLPVLLVVAGWREGRRRATTGPGWLASGTGGPVSEDGRGAFPDESAILNALRNLGIGPLDKAFKGGWKPRVVLPTGRDGKGWRTQLELPLGVTVDMINRKKSVLAHNLVRLPVEVWPTEPRSQPGVLDLWVADQGSLTGPVPPWPLLVEGGADYFKGVPVGVDIRGGVVLGRLSEANYAVAGMMGSGKSTLIITLLLGAILDPLVEVDVFVMATNADYDPMRPRLRTLLTGPGDEVVEACLDTLRAVYDDLSVRGRALQEHGERAVNRKLAEADPRLRPRIVVVDECQALFMHPDMGEEAADLTVKLISAARKYAVTLVFATPEPSTASLPRKVMAVTSNKACFAIGDQQSNDAILGTGSYTAGISATSLEPKTAEGPGDVGTCMARGFQARPGLLRSFYIAKGAGVDEVTPVVERAMAARKKAGIGAGGAAVAVEESRDLLEDLAAVLDQDPVPAADLPALLAAHAPRWAPYKTLTGKALREQLEALGVRVPSTGNRWPVAPRLIDEALGQRAAAEEGEG